MTPDEFHRIRFSEAVSAGQADSAAGRLIDDDSLDAELDSEFGPAKSKGVGIISPKSPREMMDAITRSGGRITHRIALSKPADVNAEARKWLKAAYEQDEEAQK